MLITKNYKLLSSTNLIVVMSLVAILFLVYLKNKNFELFSTPSTTPPTITGPFTITSSTDKVDTRVRGRQVSLKIENDAIDQSWRYGTLRLDIEAGGRR